MSVRSIEKTLDTLDYFLRKDARNGIALKEICDELGYKKSAAHHMLSTICDKGYLYQDLKTGLFQKELVRRARQDHFHYFLIN